MDRPPGAPAGLNAPPVFVDGFGARFLTFDPDNGGAPHPVEILSFESSLVEMPEFAATLGARVARLAGARHLHFTRVRRLDRPTADSLHLVSDRVAGWRLIDVLDVAEREALAFDISAVLSLLRQLVPAVALFARHQKDVAVGAIGPERLILTPQGRLVLTEYVLAPAIEKLGLTREQLWRQYRVAVPAIARVTPRSDVLGIGVVVLSLLLGRRLRSDEFPGAVPELLRAAAETSGGNVRPLSEGLRSWLERALQLDARTPFQSPQDAQLAFEEVLAAERGYVTSPALLDAFVARFSGIAGPPPEPVAVVRETPAAAPAAAPAPAPPGPDPVLLAGAVVSGPDPVLPAGPVMSRPDPTVPAGATVSEPDSTSAVRFRVAGDTRRWTKGALAGFALVVLIEAVAIIWLWNRLSDTLARDGELEVKSLPGAARVRIDDRDLGVTPLTVRLAPGTYTLQVQSGDAPPRVLVVQIRAGVQTSQYLELQIPEKPAEKPPVTGRGGRN